MGKLAPIPRIAACTGQTVDKYNGESGYQLVVESHKDGQIVAHREFAHAQNSDTGWTVLNAATRTS